MLLDLKGKYHYIIFQQSKNIFVLKRYCIKLLKEIKPDVVVGMGGYASGPVLKAAIKLKP